MLASRCMRAHRVATGSSPESVASTLESSSVCHINKCMITESIQESDYLHLNTFFFLLDSATKSFWATLREPRRVVKFIVRPNSISPDSLDCSSSDCLKGGTESPASRLQSLPGPSLSFNLLRQLSVFKLWPRVKNQEI